MPVFAVTTARGPNWDHARGIREQPYWDEHAVFADMLVDRGVIILGGPVASDNDEDIALLAVEAPDAHAVRSIFDADPWAVHQVFRIKHVRAWALWLDGRSRPARTAARQEGAAQVVRPGPNVGTLPFRVSWYCRILVPWNRQLTPSGGRSSPLRVAAGGRSARGLPDPPTRPCAGWPAGMRSPCAWAARSCSPR
jgi:uncharacterized protein YciI